MNKFSLVIAGSALAFSFIPTNVFAQTADTYVGAGVKTDDSSLGVISKVKITDLNLKASFLDGATLSARPNAFFGGGDVDLSVPVTIDVPLTNKITPFAGVGVNYDTSGDDDIGVYATVGADYRINRKLVANGTVNIGEDTSLVIGIGYVLK